MRNSQRFIAVELHTGGITFNPPGQITFTALSGQATYSIDQSATAKFAQNPIEFFDASGLMIDMPAGAMVNRQSDYITQINLTAPPGSITATFRFKVVLDDASGTVFRSSDPTIVIMRPEGS